MHYCAVCLIAKDENYYLREWAEYHLRIGFDVLIVYDNGSAVPIAETLAELVALGRVIVHPMPGAFAQGQAYTDCIRRYRRQFKWIAFIDSDEFVFLKKAASIKEFLGEYENYGGVVANWLHFGTDGLETREDLPVPGSQIFNFRRTWSHRHTHIKSIVQPTRVRSFTFPHGAEYLSSFYPVNSEHLPLQSSAYSSPFTDSGILIYHYEFRTWADYSAKWQRKKEIGRKMTPVTHEDLKRGICETHDELARYYPGIRNLPIEPLREPQAPATVPEMMRQTTELLSEGKIPQAEELLCASSLAFPGEAIIWLLRSVASRLKGDPQRAFHCIKEALKSSGVPMIYSELAEVYDLLGEPGRAEQARRQAAFKNSMLGQP